MEKDNILLIIYFVIIFLVVPIVNIIVYGIDDYKFFKNIEIVDTKIEKDHKKYYCKYCGSKIRDKETNCKNCGAPVKG